MIYYRFIYIYIYKIWLNIVNVYVLRKERFVEKLKNLIINLKIILLNYENNYVRR